MPVSELADRHRRHDDFLVATEEASQPLDVRTVDDEQHSGRAGVRHAEKTLRYTRASVRQLDHSFVFAENRRKDGFTWVTFFGHTTC